MINDMYNKITKHNKNGKYTVDSDKKNDKNILMPIIESKEL